MSVGRHITRLLDRAFGMFTCAALICASAPRGLAAAEAKAEPALELPAAALRHIDYRQDVQPIFQRSCYQCHDTTRRKGGLVLSTRRGAFAGGDAGAVLVAGKSAESRLLSYVAGLDPKKLMPREGERLTPTQVGILRAWIEQGALWPEEAEPKLSHWAFQPITRPAVPRVKNQQWVRNPIDEFILSTLERRKIVPSPEASRPQLLRRLKLDLVGLPPAPGEVDGFLQDRRPDAYERLVEQYLASPHYGERWGRHWLDVARYADSAGYEADFPRLGWRYRDWVIKALNQDLPFDQFVIEQIAGDLLPEAKTEDRIATGFHGNNLLEPSMRWESVIEQANTTGIAFLGLTVGCAQCHNHKTDPISNREYYQFYAFFNNARTTNLDLLTPKEDEERKKFTAQLSQLTSDLAVLERQLTNDASLAEWETGLKEADRANMPFTAQHVFKLPKSKRSVEALQTLLTARLAAEPKRQQLVTKLAELRGQIAALPYIPVLLESPKETHLFIRGNPQQEGETVQPGVPAFLPPIKKTGTLTRLDLAHWLVAPENPLTARVTVNRMWMRYFGRGLVETENDFGMQTPPPSHPELLDWLASEFKAHHWSLKAMHRLLVCSATYRQASQVRPDLEVIDPGNRLLARQSRLRLEAEIIRDASLSVSGLLSEKVGGPSVFPYQPPGVLEARASKAEWVESKGEDHYRRGMYTWFWRLTPHPFMTLFDAPDALTTCTRRPRSNTPMQALTLLNDPAFVECAKALAQRVLKEAPSDVLLGVRYLGRQCLGRALLPKEQQVLAGLVAEQLRELGSAPTEAEKIAGKDCPANVDRSQYAAWVVASRTVLNLDEFITRE